MVGRGNFAKGGALVPFFSVRNQPNFPYSDSRFTRYIRASWDRYFAVCTLRISGKLPISEQEETDYKTDLVPIVLRPPCLGVDTQCMFRGPPIEVTN